MSDELDLDEPFESIEVSAAKRTKKSGGTEAEIQLPEPEETFDPGPSDAELGEIIDGSEDDISDLENGDTDAGVAADCAPAVAAAVKAASVAAKRKKSVSMAEKKTDKTKAEYIRDEIARLKAKGEEKIRPRDIIAALEEKGVKVTAPQVSVTLRDFGKAPGEKPARKTAPVAKKAEKESKRALAKVAAHAAPRPKKAAGVALSAADLARIGAFVREYDSPQAAIAAVNAYCDYNAAITG
jgi:hypothetical protein